jgi:hypothetical protein
MLNLMSRAAIALAAVVLCVGTARPQVAGTVGWPQPEPNYYVPSATGEFYGAMYPTPRPVPPYVGMTYIPYEPLAPAEYMYPHMHSYFRSNEDGGFTRTTVIWGHHPSFHPTLRAAVPALHTPANAGRCVP